MPPKYQIKYLAYLIYVQEDKYNANLIHSDNSPPTEINFHVFCFMNYIVICLAILCYLLGDP